MKKLTYLLFVIGSIHSSLEAQSAFDKLESWLTKKHLQISYGPQSAWYKKSHITFVQEEYDRKVIFDQVKAVDDESFDFLLNGKDIGVEQFKVNIGIDLSRNYSFLITATHLTYLVQVDQTYYRNGFWDGKKVSDYVSLREYFEKLEHSNGINIWDIGIRRSFWLTSDEEKKFQLAIAILPKIGAIMTATQANVRNPNGIFERYDPGNSLAGFDYSLDFSLRLLFFQHLEISGNFNYFQFLINGAKLSTTSYVNQKLRGYHYGINLGWRF